MLVFPHETLRSHWHSTRWTQYFADSLYWVGRGKCHMGWKRLLGGGEEPPRLVACATADQFAPPALEMGIRILDSYRQKSSLNHLIDVFKVLQREFVDKLFFDGHKLVQLLPQHLHHQAAFV